MPEVLQQVIKSLKQLNLTELLNEKDENGVTPL